MSEFIFAIIGVIIGGAVGVLVMSMLTVSKMADEDAEAMDKEWMKFEGRNMRTLEQIIEEVFRKDIDLKEGEELSGGNISLCRDVAQAIRDEYTHHQ